MLFASWYAPVVDTIVFTPNPCNLEVGMTRELSMYASLGGSPATNVVLGIVSNNTSVATVASASVTTNGSGIATIEVACTGSVNNSTSVTVTSGSFLTSDGVGIVALLGGGGGFLVGGGLVQ